MSTAPELTRLERIQGMLQVHLLGDALGSGYEFGPGLGAAAPVELRKGVFGHPKGTGTDDTAVLRACAATIIQGGDFDQEIHARKLVDWADTGPLDIGGQTSRAVRSWRATNKPPAESEHAQGNGSLMGCAPLATLGSAGAQAAATDYANTTHPSATNRYHVRLFVTELAEILDNGAYAETGDELPDGWDPAGSEQGWVVGCFRVAHVALQSTLQRYQPIAPLEALRNVVRLGGDTDTNAAVAGSLLGAYYGIAPFEDELVKLDPAERLASVNLARTLHEATA